MWGGGWAWGVAAITPEGSKGRSLQRLGTLLQAVSRASCFPGRGVHAGLPAPGITAAFTEPHEELIGWRSRDECRR